MCPENLKLRLICREVKITEKRTIVIVNKEINKINSTFYFLKIFVAQNMGHNSHSFTKEIVVIYTFSKV